MRHLLACLSVAGLTAIVAGCSTCDVCHNVGGPCGFYSLAGRELPPQIESAPVEGGPESVDPYPEDPQMPTGPTAPNIR